MNSRQRNSTEPQLHAWNQRETRHLSWTWRPDMTRFNQLCAVQVKNTNRLSCWLRLRMARLRIISVSLDRFASGLWLYATFCRFTVFLFFFCVLYYLFLCVWLCDSWNYLISHPFFFTSSLAFLQISQSLSLWLSPVFLWYVQFNLSYKIWWDSNKHRLYIGKITKYT